MCLCVVFVTNKSYECVNVQSKSVYLNHFVIESPTSERYFFIEICPVIYNMNTFKAKLINI